MAEPTLIDPEKQFVVLLDNGQKVAWGPFGSREDADTFAEFAATEIDPAEVRALSSPVGELLAWRESIRHLIGLGAEMGQEDGDHA